MNLPDTFAEEHVAHIASLLTESTSAAGQQHANKILSQCEGIPGYSMCLLSILKNHREGNLPLLAAICLRNVVNRRWASAHGAKLSLTDAEKEMIRPQLLHMCLHESDEKVASQLDEAIAKVSRIDWPARFDQLFPILFTAIGEFHQPSMQDLPTFEAALPRMRRVINVFSRVVKEQSTRFLSADRRRLGLFAEECLPALFATLNHILEKVYTVANKCITPAVTDCVIQLSSCPLSDLSDIARLIVKSVARLFVVIRPRALCHDNGKNVMEFLLRSGVSLAETYARLVPLLIPPDTLAGAASGGGSIIAMGILLDDRMGLNLDCASNMGGKPCVSFARLIGRIFRSLYEIIRNHPMSCAINGTLQEFALFSAFALTRNNSFVSKLVSNPCPIHLPGLSESLMHPHVFSCCLNILALVSDCANKLASGEQPAALEHDLGGASMSMSKSGVSENADWLPMSGKQLESLYSQLFPPSSINAWISLLLEKCLPISANEIKNDWEKDPFEAAAVAEAASRTEFHNPRPFGEALLLSLVDAEATAVGLCTAILQHAKTMGSCVLKSLTPNTEIQPADLMKLDASWLAAGLSAADCIARDTISPSQWEHWAATELLPICHALGLDVVASTMELGERVQSSGVDLTVLRLVHTSCSQIPCGIITSKSPVIAGILLRRIIWIFSCFLSISPHAKVETNGTLLLRMSPFRALVLNLCIQTLALGKSPNTPDFWAGARVTACATGTAYMEGVTRGDAAVASPEFLNATIKSIFSACTTMDMDGTLGALSMLQAILYACPAPIIAASIDILLGPMSALWTSSEDLENSASIREQVLRLLIIVVNALPASVGTTLNITHENIAQLLVSLCPLIHTACDHQSTDTVFLMLPGLALWEAILEASPIYLPVFSSLLPVLHGVLKVELDDEIVPHLMTICNNYILRDTSSHTLIYETLLSSFGKVPTRVISSYTHAVETLITSVQTSSLPLVMPLITNMALSFVCAKHMNKEKEKVNEQSRALLMAALEGNTWASAHSGFPTSATEADICDLPVESDPTAVTNFALVTAKAFILSPEAFITQLASTVLTHPRSLITAGIIRKGDPLEPVMMALGGSHEEKDPMLQNLGSIGINTEILGRILAAVVFKELSLDWLREIEDIGSNGAISQLRLNKVLTMACIISIRVGYMFHKSIVSTPYNFASHAISAQLGEFVQGDATNFLLPRDIDAFTTMLLDVHHAETGGKLSKIDSEHVDQGQVDISARDFSTALTMNYNAQPEIGISALAFCKNQLQYLQESGISPEEFESTIITNINPMLVTLLRS